MVGEVHGLWIDRVHPLAVVQGNQGHRRVRYSEVVTAIGGMRSRYARHQRETGQRQVGDTGGRVRTIDGDIRIAAPGRDAEILRSADIIGTPAVREAEDATIIGLAFILEGE